jgi:hypothetical protein
MEAHARHVTKESGKARQEMQPATTARPTQTHLSLALSSQTALATRAGKGQTEGPARRVRQESIKARLPTANTMPAILQMRAALAVGRGRRRAALAVCRGRRRAALAVGRIEVTNCTCNAGWSGADGGDCTSVP